MEANITHNGHIKDDTKRHNGESTTGVYNNYVHKHTHTHACGNITDSSICQQVQNCSHYAPVQRKFYSVCYHKVREYFVYRDDHGLGCMAIHLGHLCFSFNIRWI